MFGAVWAAADLKRILGLMGARVAGSELSLPRAHERLEAPDDELLDGVRAVLQGLVAEWSPAELERVAEC